MNRGYGRLLLCVCLTVLMGCGARTSLLEDDFDGESAGGIAGLNGGSGPGLAGSPPIPVAGAPTAGAPSGGSGAGGGHTAGAPPVGGAPSAGAPAGGAGGSFGGFAGFAGFGAIGGD